MSRLWSTIFRKKVLQLTWKVRDESAIDRVQALQRWILFSHIWIIDTHNFCFVCLCLSYYIDTWVPLQPADAPTPFFLWLLLYQEIIWSLFIDTLMPSKPTQQQSTSNPHNTSAGLLYSRNTICMCLCRYEIQLVLRFWRMKKYLLGNSDTNVMAWWVRNITISVGLCFRRAS